MTLHEHILARDPNAEIQQLVIGGCRIPRYVGDLWTARQRQAAAIHEVSYRACFKAQLPRFFIEAFSGEGDTVYDPFSGRGTTAIEAALMGRAVIANDINPLSEMLARPRLAPPDPSDVQERLSQISLDHRRRADTDLSMFYHRHTEAEIAGLRDYLRRRRDAGDEDGLDRWIRMVATNRLTGHSRGFFSVYTLPPNQAVSAERQKKINVQRGQSPEYRDVRKLVLKKSKALLKNLSPEAVGALREAGRSAVFLTEDARETTGVPAESVRLTVTSPPFLNVVQYAYDNWLRCWFNAIDDEAVSARITMCPTVEAWSDIMGAVFQELFRMTRPGGHVAFEVGEVRKSRVNLDEHVVPLGLQAGFRCEGIVVNQQEFTKTSNIWGIRNNRSGTNTNRIVVFAKGDGESR